MNNSPKTHIPRKRFGQHFLTDHSVIDQLVRAIAPQSGQAMVEIGPGQAALTQPLVERLGRLTVIELDRDLAQTLRRHPLLNVIEADVLNVNFADVARQLGSVPLRVVGNLPYNISTPILFHLLQFSAHIQDQHFMLQKEVVERITAPVNTEHYSRLSVMLQAHYEVENILAVPPDCFDPPPKVDSAVVRMMPKASSPTPPPCLGELVRVAFSQRRKLLRHTLGPWLAQQDVQLDFDLQRRAQEVPLAEYLALAQGIKPT